MGRYLLFFLVLLITSGARASADPQDIATTNAPVVFAQIASGTVTIRTWDRPDVQIDADSNLVQINHIPEQALAGRQLPPMRFFAQNVQTPEGEELSLPPEPFPVAPLDSQPHDAVRLVGSGDMTITVPANTPFLMINGRQGEVNVNVNGYHGGTFVSHIGRGTLHLNDVSGTVGAQVNNGSITATNSTFDRIRVRNVRGGVYFQNCDSRQIEATTLLSPIVYDNGSFQPGLARFESQKGNIALGVGRGGAMIDAHSASGRVMNEGIIRGGPVVTATSSSGNVMTYSGALSEHPNFRQQFPMRQRTTQQPRAIGAPQRPNAPPQQRRRSGTRPRPFPTPPSR